MWSVWITPGEVYTMTEGTSLRSSHSTEFNHSWTVLFFWLTQTFFPLFIFYCKLIGWIYAFFALWINCTILHICTFFILFAHFMHTSTFLIPVFCILCVWWNILIACTITLDIWWWGSLFTYYSSWIGRYRPAPTI